MSKDVGLFLRYKYETIYYYILATNESGKGKYFREYELQKTDSPVMANWNHVGPKEMAEWTE
jgi:hypothetical protein